MQGAGHWPHSIAHVFHWQRQAPGSTQEQDSTHLCSASASLPPPPAPPHLQEDGSIALLDFGQCKALSAPQQVNLCRLYQGLAQGRALQVAQCAASFGLHLGPQGDASQWDLQAVVKMVTVMFDVK